MKAYVVYDTVARDVLAVFSTECAAQDLCRALQLAGEARGEANVDSIYEYDECEIDEGLSPDHKLLSASRTKIASS